MCVNNWVPTTTMHSFPLQAGQSDLVHWRGGVVVFVFLHKDEGDVGEIRSCNQVVLILVHFPGLPSHLHVP